MKSVFFFFIFIISTSCIAQFNFYEGYIILNEGDTIRGEIKANPKKELSLFAKVMFRDKDGIGKTYKANKIKGFAYYNSEKQKWHQFVAITEEDSKFYKISIQCPLLIYEYQYEDMQMGEFYTTKEYYIKQGDKYVRLKSKKLKKQLSEYIDNPEVLSEIEKMEELDIDKLSSLFERHYSKS